MHGVRILLCLSAAGLALSACSKPADKTAASATPAATAPPAVAPAPQAETGLPTRAPGLWKQTIDARGAKQVVTICMDADTDKKMAVWSQGMGMEKCSKRDVHRGLDGAVIFESACDIGPGGVVTSKGSATGDFNSHYIVTIDSTITGSMSKRMNGASTTVIDAVRTGDCPSGWKGGDMEVPGAGRINLERMQKQAEQLRGLSGRLSIKP
jgi:hypothetical protein